MKKQLATASPGDPPSLEEILFNFRRKFIDIMRREAERLHCPISQVDALTYIVEQGNPSMKEIAQHLSITPPSATSIINTLEKKKLIIRVSSKSDRRTIRVALTPKAWKLFKSFHAIKLDILRNMFSKLKEGEQKQFIEILNKLIKE